MSRLPTDDLGQLLFIGLEEDRWSAGLEKRLRAIRPGGIIFSQRTLRTPESVAGLLGKIAQTLGAPPFLAIEEEGGTVDPLHEFFPPLPSLRAAGVKENAAAKLGELIGAGMKLLGFNTNFAPRLDLAADSSGAAAGARPIGSDSLQVAKCGGDFARGLQRHNILPCARHFPGFGSARMDSEAGLYLSGKPMAPMWREDLVPYRKLLRQLPMVMVSHHAYKAYDFDVALPAIHSVNVLQGLLRVKLSYHGVALTSDLESEYFRRKFDPADASVLSINAGCDMVSISNRKNSAESVIDGLRNGLESGRISTHRVAQALQRIRRARKALAAPTGRISMKALKALDREFKEFSNHLKTSD
ncbi:MAG: glycoside hydrolase family 3 N-terminal domain-containing protein [Terriglobia bacterium]